MTKPDDPARPVKHMDAPHGDRAQPPVDDQPATTATLPRKGRKAALAFIFVTALLDVIALGIMIPVLPNLVKEFRGGDTASAADWNVIFAVSWGVMQFIGAPILGMMSDRFGRRPIILISIFGLGVDFLFMALAPTLEWLLVGRILNGFTAASFATAGAYIADVTPPEKRAAGFGLIGAAWGAGFIVGPALGGWLAESTLFGLLADPSLRTPFYVAAALALCNWLYGFFVLPESLPKERRATRFHWRKANPVGSAQLLRSRPAVAQLAGVTFLFQLAHNVLPAIFALYVGYRYGWSPATMGLTMMGTGLANTFVQAVLVGRAVKRFGERRCLLFGLGCGAAAFAWYAWAPSGTLYLLAIPLFALSGLIGPSVQSLMSRRVRPDEQGQLQGANSMLMGVASMIGPALFGLTFAWSIRNPDVFHAPGLAIYIAALLLLAALALAWKVARPEVGAVAPQAAQPQPA